MNERKSIPERGVDPDTLLDQLRGYREGDLDWRGGRTWSLVYHAGEEHEAVLERAHGLFFSENALDPMAFRSLRRMEDEVVQMTASMLHAPPSAVGAMTSGGTESILMAVKTCRDRARARRPWVRRPSAVVPRTIHPAFDKAAHYFGVRLKKVRVDRHGQVDVDAMRRRIDRSTIMLACSAPQFVHGVVDPVPAVAALARRRGLPLHVDACFGGFIQPWLERLGVDMPAWDFRVEGVTSVSADVHKYGYAPKGSSVVLYRDMALMRHQFFVCTSWPGGVYASATFPGTRPGGAIAAAWASLVHLGEDGYLELARTSLDVARRLRRGLAAIDGLRVLGLPHSTIVTWAAEDPDDVDVFAVADQLAGRGWGVDRQQDPPSIHCSASPANARAVDDYLRDVADAVARVRAHPELSREGEAAMYGMMARVPARGLVRGRVLDVMEELYAPGAREPDLEDGLGPDGPLGDLVDRYGPAVLERLDRLRRRLRDLP